MLQFGLDVVLRQSSLVTCSALLFAILPTLALADSFSTLPSANPETPQHLQTTALSCGSIELSQTASQSIAPLNSASCNSGEPGYFHNNISYFRAFSLGEFPYGFSACAVRVGIESANAAGTGTSQPMIVRLYANTGAPFPAGNRQEIAATTVSITDQVRTVVDIPLQAAVLQGAELVAEVFTPKGLSAGHSLFIGSNALGQSAPGYVYAPACGLTGPTPFAAIGFPNTHLVLSVLGSPYLVSQNLSLTPSSVNFGPRVVGSTTIDEINLKNASDAAVVVSGISVGSAPFFRLEGSCAAVPFTLAPGTYCTVKYSFKPLTAEKFEQVVTINSSAGAPQLTLEGEGNSVLVLVPSLNFHGQLLLGMLFVLLGVIALRRVQ